MSHWLLVLTTALVGRAAERQPERATDRALWLSASGARLRLGYRAEVPFALGPELGAYPIRYLRVAGRFLVAPAAVADGCHDVAFLGGHPAELGYWFCQPSRSARFAFSLSAGVVVLDTRHWAIAPGLTLQRSDVPDYGTALGASLPIDWLPRPGLRLGLDLSLGDTLGQKLLLVCSGAPMTSCAPNTTAAGPNLFTWFGSVALSVGWSFDLRRGG